MPCEHWSSVRICTDSNIWHWDGLKFLASDFGHSFHSTSHCLPPTKRRHLRNFGIHNDRGARCDRCFYYGHEMTLAKVFWVNVTRWPWQCSSNCVHLPQFSGWVEIEKMNPPPRPRLYSIVIVSNHVFSQSWSLPYCRKSFWKLLDGLVKAFDLWKVTLMTSLKNKTQQHVFEFLAQTLHYWFWYHALILFKRDSAASWDESYSCCSEDDEEANINSC